MSESFTWRTLYDIREELEKRLRDLEKRAHGMDADEFFGEVRRIFSDVVAKYCARDYEIMAGAARGGEREIRVWCITKGRYGEEYLLSVKVPFSRLWIDVENNKIEWFSLDPRQKIKVDYRLISSTGS